MQSFLLVIAVSTIVNAISVPLTPTFSCPGGPLPRKEWRSLTTKDQKLYIDTVLKVQRRPSRNKPSIYDSLAKFHNDLADKTHEFSVFFPWHRWFLYLYEKELQKFSPKMRIPFWNWAFDSQAPELAPVWGKDAFGDNGVEAKDNCISVSPFAKFRPFYPKDHCLRRMWSKEEDTEKSGPLGAFHSTDLINKIITTSKTYYTLYESFYIPHGIVHDNIGGDMGSMYSPMDPIFYLHHAMVDKVWANWQKAFPALGKTYDGVKFGGGKATLNDLIEGSKGVRVSHLLDTNKLCYYYEEMKKLDAKMPALNTQGARQAILESVEAQSDDEQVEAAKYIQPKGIKPIDSKVKAKPAPEGHLTVKSSDRTNLLSIRIPRPLSERWLRANGISIRKARRREGAAAEIIKELNKISGYVSPCALWNRPDVLTKLVIKIPVFVADVNNTRLEIRNDKPATNKTVDDKDAKKDPVLLEKAADVLTRVRESLPAKKVQEPIKDVAVKLYDVIGPPVNKKDSAANPFAPRHDGEKGYGIKDKEIVEEKAEKEKEDKPVDEKKEEKKEKVDKDLGGDAKEIARNSTIKNDQKSAGNDTTKN